MSSVARIVGSVSAAGPAAAVTRGSAPRPVAESAAMREVLAAGHTGRMTAMAADSEAFLAGYSERLAAKLEQQGATDAQATGRIAAVYGASAPRPVAQPSRKGQTKEAIGVVVSN